MDPDNIDALNSLAQCIRATATTNVFNQVSQLYQKALSLDSEDFETNFNFGVLYYEQKKDYDKAIHHLKLAVNEEANANAYFNLAVVYEEKGDSQEAIKAYQEVR